MLGLHGEKERGRKARIKSLGVSVAGKEELGNGPHKLERAHRKGWTRRARPAMEFCEGHMVEFLIETKGEKSEKVLGRDVMKGVFWENESG